MDLESDCSDFMALPACFCNLYLVKCLPKPLFYVHFAEVKIPIKIARLCWIWHFPFFMETYEI